MIRSSLARRRATGLRFGGQAGGQLSVPSSSSSPGSVSANALRTYVLAKAFDMETEGGGVSWSRLHHATGEHLDVIHRLLRELTWAGAAEPVYAVDGQLTGFRLRTRAEGALASRVGPRGQTKPAFSGELRIRILAVKPSRHGSRAQSTMCKRGIRANHDTYARRIRRSTLRWRLSRRREFTRGSCRPGPLCAGPGAPQKGYIAPRPWAAGNAQHAGRRGVPFLVTIAGRSWREARCRRRRCPDC